MAAKYRVKDDVRVETNHAWHDRIVRNFSGGEVTAKSEQDEILLELLVENGMAERVAAEPKKKKES